MAWFNRTKKNIEAQSTRDMPDGLWTQCSNCGEITYKKQLEENMYTCPTCNKHFRIGSNQYIDVLLDTGSFEEHAAELISTDPLGFVDEKPYTARLAKGRRDTGLNDAMRIGAATIDGRPLAIAITDFSFIGGSMGSVVGEKFCRAVDLAIERRMPMVAVSASGGARMMEAAISLMQMAKTSVRLARLAEERIPYIVVLTDPTTGGVTASFAMLGDVILAEPNALIGFAGPRVIEQMTKKKLPEGFQRSEFQLKHGFVDHIVHRKDMRRMLSRLFTLMPIPEKGVDASR